MTDEVRDWASFVVLAAVAMVVTTTAARRFPAWFGQLIVVGMALRIVGSIARLEVARQVYRSGDYGRYYRAGLFHADKWWSFDFSGISAWIDGPQWWGTQFLEVVSGVVLFFIGRTLHGEFLVFAALGYLGLVLIVIGYLRLVGGRGRFVAYACFLLPSLVYWPSSVGKEAMVLLGLGLAFHGYAVGGRGTLLRIGVGLALLASIRPHIAMMIAVALALAEWVQQGRGWTPSRIAQGCALAVVASIVVVAAFRQFDIEGEYGGDITAFVEERSARTATGGSAITPIGGPLMIPAAFVNVLFRPFLWEVRNPVTFLSAVEALLFWWLVFRHRRGLWRAIRHWRRSRVLRFALPAAIVLVIFYGGFISNLGILARQRVVVLPLLFIVLDFGRIQTVRTDRPAKRTGSSR
ncbi:MAG: hypothetical protein Q8O67_04295 [Deltaproteobacteria bacterium]|nr:hypothetical protein [Deltaproteobacteria bacterium]